MQIIVTPNDIIQRCLWDKYKRFVLHDKTEDEITNLITDNKPLVVSENDAFVIGLLKIVETDVFTHRFNQDILEYLQIKSTIIEGELYITKYAVEKFITTYKSKFPVSYNPKANFQQGLDDLFVYIDDIESKRVNVETISVKNKDKMITYYLSKDIKKLLVL